VIHHRNMLGERLFQQTLFRQMLFLTEIHVDRHIITNTYRLHVTFTLTRGQQFHVQCSTILHLILKLRFSLTVTIRVKVKLRV